MHISYFFFGSLKNLFDILLSKFFGFFLSFLSLTFGFFNCYFILYLYFSFFLIIYNTIYISTQGFFSFSI